jgi:hypothetical protein
LPILNHLRIVAMRLITASLRRFATLRFKPRAVPPQGRRTEDGGTTIACSTKTAAKPAKPPTRCRSTRAKIIHPGAGKRLRVLNIVVAEDDSDKYVGFLRVEAAYRSDRSPRHLAAAWASRAGTSQTREAWVY